MQKSLNLAGVFLGALLLVLSGYGVLTPGVPDYSGETAGSLLIHTHPRRVMVSLESFQLPVAEEIGVSDLPISRDLLGGRPSPPSGPEP